MELGMIRLGRIGIMRVRRRLLRSGHQCVVYDIDAEGPNILHHAGAGIQHRIIISSRGKADLADKILSAMRCGFGGHAEKATIPKGGAS